MSEEEEVYQTFRNADRDYPVPQDRYSGICSCCEHSFAGPKRAGMCYPCSRIGEQLIFDFASI